MIDELKDHLENSNILFSIENGGILINLPNNFGILEIRMLGEQDNIIGLREHPWHTHGELLMTEEIASEAEAICNFIKDVLKGKYLMVEILKDNISIQKYLSEADQISLEQEYLEEGETLKIYNHR